jgi:hypothetical protein
MVHASSCELAGEGAGRFFLCARCRAQVLVCRRCDRGQTYCSEYKLYVAERYASKEYLTETKREILDSIRDFAGIKHP